MSQTLAVKTRREFKYAGSDDAYQKYLEFVSQNYVSRTEIKEYRSAYYDRNKSEWKKAKVIKIVN